MIRIKERRTEQEQIDAGRKGSAYMQKSEAHKEHPRKLDGPGNL
jgi:hypothetical protein